MASRSHAAPRRHHGFQVERRKEVMMYVDTRPARLGMGALAAAGRRHADRTESDRREGAPQQRSACRAPRGWVRGRRSGGRTSHVQIWRSWRPSFMRCSTLTVPGTRR